MSSYFEPDAGGQKISSGTTSVPIILPDLITAAPTAIVSGLANAFGAWFQVVAAGILTSHMLNGIAWSHDAVGYGAIQVGVGAAGAEVVIGTWGMATVAAESTKFYAVVPALTITANARVAVRGLSNAGAVGLTSICHFIPRPLA